MKGADKMVGGVVHFQGKELDTGHRQGLMCPVELYEADIAVDAIISYAWLAECDFLVNPRRHGLLYRDQQGMVWLEVVRESAATNVVLSRPGTHREEGIGSGLVEEVGGEGREGTQGTCRTRFLELCSFTGSITKVFEEWGYDVVSGDVDTRYHFTIVADNLTWDYRHTFPQGHFEVVACTPPMHRVQHRHDSATSPMGFG
jgi:hypothetical protein